MSEPHDLAIILIEGPERDFRHHVFGILRAATAHLEYDRRFGIRGNAILRQLHDLAIIRRDQARWSHQIRLPEAFERHLLGVIGVAKERPEKIERLWTA